MGRRIIAACAALFLAASCVPAFEGERPRKLLVDTNDAGANIDAGASIDAGVVERDGGPPPSPRDGGPPPYSGPTYVDDVRAIFEAECQGCHSNPTRFDAPMPLVTYADLVAASPSDAARPVHEVVAERVVSRPGERIMPPAGALGAELVRTIGEWSRNGAPEGPRTP